MRALWLVRADLEAHPGGDTTQIQRTAAALRKRGLSVVLSSDPRPDLRNVDVVHLWHLDRIWENLRWCQQIRAAGVPSVLSPIYWPTEEYDRRGRVGLQGLMSRLVGADSYQSLRILQRSAIARHDRSSFSHYLWSFARAARFVLESVDSILPNSRVEQAALEERFGVRHKYVVVPNAAHARTFKLPRSTTEREPSTVLCVGRIEPRKNQLALIRAVRNSDIHLQIAGQGGRFSHRYARLCRKEAGPNVAFLGWKSPAELRSLYQAAKVHASVSWYETPGLANLEAGLMGCTLVVTTGGSTREYFGDAAEYCVPDDPASIDRALRAALARRSEDDLSRRITTRYTWEAAADRTLDAYDTAVKPRLRAIRSHTAHPRASQSRATRVQAAQPHGA